MPKTKTPKVAKAAPAAAKQEKKEVPPCVLILFKVEGHETYRAVTKSSEDQFDKEVAIQKNHPKITEKKIFVVDRLNGTVNEKK